MYEIEKVEACIDGFAVLFWSGNNACEVGLDEDGKVERSTAECLECNVSISFDFDKLQEAIDKKRSEQE